MWYTIEERKTRPCTTIMKGLAVQVNVDAVQHLLIVVWHDLRGQYGIVLLAEPTRATLSVVPAEAALGSVDATSPPLNTIGIAASTVDILTILAA